MNEDQKKQHKRIIVRSSLYWVWAIATPTVVMIILDLFDKHTPNNIVMFSLMFMIIPYQLCNLYLSRELGRVMTGETANES